MDAELINVFIQIPMHIFWKDLSSVFIGCNHHFAIAAGLVSSKEIIGKSDFDLAWAESHADLYQHGDLEVLDGEIKSCVIEPQLQANGKLINIIINKVPYFNNDGQKIGVVGSYMEMQKPEYHGVLDLNKRNIPLTSRQGDCK